MFLVWMNIGHEVSGMNDIVVYTFRVFVFLILTIFH